VIVHTLLVVEMLNADVVGAGAVAVVMAEHPSRPRMHIRGVGVLRRIRIRGCEQQFTFL
jgi:hypothetical protein